MTELANAAAALAGEREACTLLTPERKHGSGGDAAAAEAVAADPKGMNVCGRLDKDSRGLLVRARRRVGLPLVAPRKMRGRNSG